MKKEELYREIGFIEEELIEAANYEVKKKSFSKKMARCGNKYDDRKLSFYCHNSSSLL